MNISKKLPHCTLSPRMTLAAAVLLSGCITLLALWCQPNALRSVLAVLKAQPLLIVLNAMPVGLLVLLFTFLFQNVFFSAALVNFLVCGASIVNRMKIEIRDEPLFPRDIALLKEASQSLESYALHFPATVILTVLLGTLILTAAGLVLRCRPFPTARFHGWLCRLLGCAGSFALLTVLILTVYASNDLYNSFRVSNAYYIPSVFNELGFPYCFCHQFTTYPVDKPDGYSRTQAETWEQAPVSAGQGKDVHVIMVMNEAFSDLPDASVFHWEEDPLSNLHALQAGEHSISGHIVVPGFAGGTANTEFDVLTGMQTNALSAVTTSAMRVVNRNQDSLFRVFHTDGYRTSYFHCGDDWFYNRENVLRWFGAGETVFIDQMEHPEMKGRWVTDNYMAGLIEAEFERARAAGQSLFHYTTTIQNHMSYTADKYGSTYHFPAIDVSLPLSDSARTMLEVYMEGVRDADAMLGRLQSYFSQCSEPVVLVYFGDHLPYLGDNQQTYAELGLTEAADWEELSSYETPYLIWANDAAAEILDWDHAVTALALPEDGRISAAFLGSVVLELTGRAEDTPWFQFLSQLRREVPVVQKQLLILSDGSRTAQPEPALKDAILKWRQWSYYKLQQKEISS